MSNISFSEDAWEDYLYWQLQDKKTLKKINELLKEIQRTPFSGKGEPEKLRGDLNGKWSRRINLKDRLVYEISDETIIVIQCKGHYSDPSHYTAQNGSQSLPAYSHILLIPLLAVLYLCVPFCRKSDAPYWPRNPWT